MNTEIKTTITKKIELLMSIGYTQAEAEKKILKAVELIKAGKKKASDILN